MDLQAVRIRNFLSVEEAVIDFSGTGLTLVVGPTGSGKSALLAEPLLWQFYDVLSRPVQWSQMDRVRRRYHGQPVSEDTSVETWFTHRNHTYYVLRSLKSGWKIVCDGSVITPYKTKAAGVGAMADIIGLPSHLFRSLVVMGQGFSERFSGYKDSERTSVIEDFLGAAEYERAQQSAREQLASIGPVHQQLQVQKDLLQQSVNLTQARITDAEQQMAQWREESTSTRRLLEEKIENLNNLREQKVAEYSQVSAEHGKITAAFSSIVEVEKAQSAAYEKYLSQVGSQQCRYEDAVHKKDRLVRIGAGECPTCFQIVDGSHLAKVLMDVESEISRELSALSHSKEQLSAYKESLEEARIELETLRAQCASYTSSLSSIQVEVREIDSRLSSLQGEIGRLKDMDSVSAKSLEAHQDRLFQESSQLQSVEQALQKCTSIQPYLDWWSEGFSIRGIRSKRLGDVLATMNTALEFYCQEFFENQIVVRLLPVKPRKTTVAKSAVSLEVSSPAGCYELSSGGQERCIDLAIHFALRRFAKQAAFGWSGNFLIGDEVFDYLDRSLSSRAVEIIRREADRVFLITHSRDLQSFCDSVWSVYCEDERTSFTRGTPI